jgi:predicted metalloprotease
VFIDLGFYQELKDRFGAPGDAAQAYVLAHEIGHHVQKLLGTEEKFARCNSSGPTCRTTCRSAWSYKPIATPASGPAPPSNAESWRRETSRKALGAAASVGDDRLQRMSTGHVNPESFTHGSSAQRQQWFQRGFQNSDPRGVRYVWEDSRRETGDGKPGTENQRSRRETSSRAQRGT